MSKLTELASEAQNFARQFRAFSAFAEAVENAGQLAQEVAEHERVAEQAKAKRAEALKDLEAANTALRESRTKLGDTERHANELVANAEQKAGEAKAQADASIKETVEAARAKMRQEVEAHRLVLKEGQEKLDALRTDTQAAEARLAQVQAALDALKAKL